MQNNCCLGISDPLKFPSMLNRDKAFKNFKAYASAFNLSDSRVALKFEHTMRVAELCENVSVSLGLTQEDVDLAWLCGLLHDIGRFEQLRLWGTFRDSASCSHAQLGLAILDGKTEFVGRKLSGADGCLSQFIESASACKIVRDVVSHHSDLNLPSDLDSRTRLFCEILRDADKIDIIRVFGTSEVEDVLNLSPEEFLRGEISDSAIAGFREHRCLSPADRNSNLDGLVGVICLPFELVFEPSRIILNKRGHLQTLIDQPFGLTPAFKNKSTAKKYTEIRETIAEV